MAAHTGLTWHVAEWIAEQPRRPLPTDLDRHLRRMTLDAVAGMVASSRGAVSHAVATHAATLYPGDEVTAIGHGRASILGAALVNGTNGHGIESDEGYTPGSMHPTSVVLPTVFALGQSISATAVQIRTAAAIGMELACRIAAAGHPATRNRHFHNTPLGGVFGAAAAAAVLRGLTVTETANALEDKVRGLCEPVIGAPRPLPSSTPYGGSTIWASWMTSTARPVPGPPL